MFLHFTLLKDQRRVYVSGPRILAIEPDPDTPNSILVCDGGLLYFILGSPEEVRANIATQLGA